MNNFEAKIADSFKAHGWNTDVEEITKPTREVDLVAYEPKTGKTFFGNLTHLSSCDDTNIYFR